MSLGALIPIFTLIAGETVKAETRPRPPIKIKPGDISSLGFQADELRKRGIEPKISIDPFSGDFVLSRASQDEVLQDILLDRAAREAGISLFGAPKDDRDPFGIAGPASGPPPIPFEELPALEPTARNPSPGVVTRGGKRSSSRLSGPCAGVVSGLQKLRCSRGGFA